MPRGTSLTEKEKGMIEAHHSQGMSIGKIADRINRSKTVVHNYLRAPGRYGKARRPGRPALLSATAKRHIVRRLSKGSKTICEVKSDLQLEVSKTTIRRVVKAAEQFKYKKRKTAPLLTYAHKVKRLEWAFYYNRFKPEEWDKVVFSDEKKFNGDGPDDFSYYWHDLRFDEKVFSNRQQGGFSVMVWGCFSKFGKCDLVFLEGNDSQKYTSLLGSVLLPWADALHDYDWIYQQDNASIHVSRHSMTWFVKEKIASLEWPAHSPDLNPIEKLWAYLVRRVYADSKHYDSVGELKEAIIDAWKDTDPIVLHKLIRSMPRRCEAVMRANGAKTKY